MENENKGVETKEEDLTSNQDAPTGEAKDSQKVEDTQSDDEEKVTISKKEWEDKVKRADDFNRSIELKRLSKLGNKEVKSDDDENFQEEINQLREEINNFKTESYNSKLSEAYREFISTNKWTNEDATFDKIKENFKTVGTETKEELLSKFNIAAQTAFPVEYQKHLEDKIKAKVLSEKFADNSGGGVSTDGTMHKDNKQKTKEDEMKEKMASLYVKAQPGR